MQSGILPEEYGDDAGCHQSAIILTIRYSSQIFASNPDRSCPEIIGYWTLTRVASLISAEDLPIISFTGSASTLNLPCFSFHEASVEAFKGICTVFVSFGIKVTR